MKGIHLKGWKKVHDGGDHTIMQNFMGHEMKIQHKPLSKKMREDLKALPISQRKEAKPSGPAQAKIPAEAKQEPIKPIKLAHGGPVKMAFAGEVGGREDTPPPQEQEVQGPPTPSKEAQEYDRRLRDLEIMRGPAKGTGAPGSSDIDLQQKVLGEMTQQKQSEADAAALAQQTLAEKKVAAAQTTMDINAKRQALGLPPLPAGQGLGMPAQGMASQQPMPGQRANASAAPAAPSDPFGYGAQQEAQEQGYTMQQKGLAGEAEAQANMGHAQEKSINAAAQAEMNLQKEFHETYQALEDDRKARMEALDRAKINPNKYWEERSIPGKVSSIIGMILGGLGGGLLHQENPALKLFQAQVDNSLKAQQANLGKQENLLAANMKQFGNLHDAMNITRMQLHDKLAMDLQKAAAHAQDPMAKARLLQEAGKLMQANAPIAQQLAMKKTLLSGAARGVVNPAMAISAVYPKEHQEPALKELKEAQMGIKARDNVLSAFDQIAKLNTMGSRLGNPVQSASQIDALWQPLVAQLSKETAGRFTEQDAQMLDKLKPMLKDNPETAAKKRTAILKLISEKLQYPHLKSQGIDLTPKGLYDEAGRLRIQEAAPNVR